MLANRNAMATIAVRDIDAARNFYGLKLGLQQLESGEEGVLSFQSGAAVVVVYVSKFAGTNQATSVTWAVGAEFDAIMNTLRANGVVFEHYDIPGLKFENGAHMAGDFKGAWFKDPDGNILHLLNR
jgi:catechol 2,3-dioxygenase-like lactoylglutathione lyase family enzyme